MNSSMTIKCKYLENKTLQLLQKANSFMNMKGKKKKFFGRGDI